VIFMLNIDILAPLSFIVYSANLNTTHCDFVFDDGVKDKDFSIVFDDDAKAVVWGFDSHKHCTCKQHGGGRIDLDFTSQGQVHCHFYGNHQLEPITKVCNTQSEYDDFILSFFKLDGGYNYYLDYSSFKGDDRTCQVPSCWRSDD